MNNFGLYLLAVLLFGLVCFSCYQSSGDDDDKLTGAKCNEISETCEASSKLDCKEYQCVHSEQETPGCLIEKEGYYNHKYFICVKNMAENDCNNILLLWQNNCLESCYYEKIDYETYAQAEEECMDLCVYSIDY